MDPLPANPTPEQLEAAYAQGLLRKTALVHGAYYRGRCRNATVARWNEPGQHFIHWRTKFTNRFLEAIRHPEDEKVFDVFLATEEIIPEEWDRIDDADFEKYSRPYPARSGT